jgi:hypothetical protein
MRGGAAVAGGDAHLCSVGRKRLLPVR